MGLRDRFKEGVLAAPGEFSSPEATAELYFWQNAPSIHQAPVIKELATRPHANVTVICDEKVSEARMGLGWAPPDMTPARVVMTPSSDRRRAVEEGAAGGAVHIFTGLGAYPGVSASMARLAQTQGRRIVFSEPWNPQGLKGRLRRTAYRRRLKLHGRDIDLFLTVGELAMRQFVAAGVSPDRCAPFGYFPDAPSIRAAEQYLESGRVHLAFVGQLVARKRLGMLLSALGQFQGDNWLLSIAGTGDAESELRDQAHALGLERQVRWLGSLPHAKVGDLLGAADCLVLPSAFDGWGAVVNEALLCGARVIVSATSGSSQLIDGPESGRVFVSEAELVRSLNEVIGDGSLTAERRADLRERSMARFTPEVGATYLEELLAWLDSGGPRPPAPWL